MDLRPLHLAPSFAARVGAIAFLRSSSIPGEGAGSDAAAEERRRIARELHDGLAQELAFLVTQAKLLVRSHPEMLEVHQLETAAQRALDETRIAIAGLTTSGSTPLADAVEAAAEEVAHREGVRLHLDLDRTLEAPAEVRDSFVRIVREAATNAIKHGRTERIDVRLFANGGIHLVVADAGVGFARETACGSGGFGLVSMSERVRALGGELRIVSEPGSGTRLEVTVR